MPGTHFNFDHLDYLLFYAHTTPYVVQICNTTDIFVFSFPNPLLALFCVWPLVLSADFSVHLDTL